MSFGFSWFFPAGMQAIFEIKKCFPNVHKPRPHGELRQFFIAAEEEVWDYAPTLPNDRLVTTHTRFHRNGPGWSWCFCKRSIPLIICTVCVCVCSEADMFVTRGQNRIGSRYKKVRYVEYTDNTFTTKMLRTPEEQHLGILGNPGWAGVGSTF